MDGWSVVNSDDDDPWSGVLPIEAVSALQNLLQCRSAPIGIDSTQQRLRCETALAAAYNRNWFNESTTNNDTELYAKALKALLSRHKDQALSAFHLNQLYTDLLPNRKLPFCVNVDGERHSWYVPIAADKSAYIGCVAYDHTLRNALLASSVLGPSVGGDYWRGGDILRGGGRWDEPPFRTLVRVVYALLAVKSAEDENTGRRVLIDSDRRLVMRCLTRKIKEIQKEVRFDEQQQRLLAVAGDLSDSSNLSDALIARWLMR